jgi:acyl dehydratase
MFFFSGEQSIVIKKPIPANANIKTSSRIAHIYDKGKGAVVVMEAVTKDEKGEEICVNSSSLFIRGIGGFGGDRGPSEVNPAPPNPKKPDAVFSQKTSANQALIYRLCGDLNPLHIDPQMAAMGGFDKPILHGLCTMGYAGKLLFFLIFVARAVIKTFANNDSGKVKSVKVRFTKHVFPGETVVTEMWKLSPTSVLFQAKVAERPDGYVLSNAIMEFNSPVEASSNVGGNVSSKL